MDALPTEEEIIQKYPQETRDFLALPEQTTHFGCVSHNQTPNDTAIQTTLIKGSISFRSSDTEDKALEVAERFHETLKRWIGEIYHPEREMERWLASKVSQPVVDADQATPTHE